MRILLFARIFASVISLFLTIFLARTLGPENWGVLSYSLAILFFLALFIDFGFYASASSLIVKKLSKKKNINSTLGAILAIFIAVCMLFAASIYLIARTSEPIVGKEVADLLNNIYLYSWIFLAPSVSEQILKATGHVEELGVVTIISKITPVPLITLCSLMYSLEPLGIMYCNMAAYLIMGVVAIKLGPPIGMPTKRALLELLLEKRNFGGRIYFSRLANLASYNSDKILLGAFSTAQSVGMYNLAMSLCSGITLLASTISVSKFKSFGVELIDEIYFNKVRRLLIAISITSVGVIYFVVYIYLGVEFREVFILSILCSIALLFQGLYQPYNSWLLARGKGELLKRFLIKNAFINSVANIAFIPTFGAPGAAIASIIGNYSYLSKAKAAYASLDRAKDGVQSSLPKRH